MLSREENELLTRVGPGTPMGACCGVSGSRSLEHRIARHDSDPVRVRLLGEDLVAFRDTQRAGRPAAEQLPPPRRVAVLRTK